MSAGLLLPTLSDTGSTGLLFPNPIIGMRAGGMVVGDFNGDGKPDLAITDYSKGEVAIELGRGNATFAPERRFAVGLGPGEPVVGDFNEDGRQDLAVVNEGDISILLGLGDGSFAPQTLIPVGDGPRDLTVDDFNADGHQDLTVLNVCATGNTCETGEVAVLIGAGDGTFAPATSYPAAVEPISIVSGDFNGDGQVDLIAGSTNRHFPDPVTELSLLPGHGDGTFGPQIPTGEPYSGSGPIAVGDFDADGRLDLAVSAFKSSAVTIFMGRGDGTFLESFLDTGRRPFEVAIDDFDGDGRQDVATADSDSREVSVFLGRGDGTFAERIAVPAGAASEHLTFGDLDLDGRLDLIVGNSASETVLIRLGNGDGTFGTPARDLDSFDAAGMALADFNNDGKPDLVVSYWDSFPMPPPGDLSVLLGAGDGTFGPELHLGPAIGRGPAVTDDFNGDGRLDFAVGNRERGNISVFLGGGDGSFATETLFGAGSDPAQIASGDLNGDGVPDLVVVNQAVYFPQVAGDLSILIGRGDGGFLPEVRMSGGSSPVFVTLGDFDADGQADLAVVNEDAIGDEVPGYVLIFAGRGDGTFTAGSRLEAGPSTFQAVARDFNGDGRLDLAVNNRGLLTCLDFCGGDLSLFLGNGDGTFVPQVRLSAGGSPIVLAAADVDRDGDVDLMTANMSFDVSVLFNQGDGSFAKLSRFGIKGAPQALAAGDLDGDGLTDLAAIGFSALTVLSQLTSPNSPPSASIVAVSPVECTDPTGALVRLDGSGSTDPDSTPGTNDDIASFEWFESFGAPGQSLIGAGPILERVLPLGSHDIALVVTDRQGLTSQEATTVQVRDTTPPAIVASNDPTVLWPPNHRIVPVRVQLQIADRCDPLAAGLLVGATSGEPDDAPGGGDGNTTGDIQMAPAGSPVALLLRAERSADGPGRVYTLTYQARDASGNTASALSIVSVPHDEGSGPEPVMLNAEGNGAPGMVHLYWAAVPGAESYDVIRGDVSLIAASSGTIRLGPVNVLVAGLTAPSYSEESSGAIPSAGQAFFYLVQYRQGQSASGWGTESSAWPAEPSSCDTGCPGEPVLSAGGSRAPKRK